MFVRDSTFPRKLKEGAERARQSQLTKARSSFSELVNRAAFGKERITLTRHGKPVAAVVPIEDVQLLEALEERLDLDDARAALAEAKRKGARPLRTVIKELAG